MINNPIMSRSNVPEVPRSITGHYHGEAPASLPPRTLDCDAAAKLKRDGACCASLARIETFFGGGAKRRVADEQLTVHQAGVGPLQLQDNVNHHPQEGAVHAVTLVMDEDTGGQPRCGLLLLLMSVGHGEGLTCEYVVVAVHLVELYALVQNLQLLGRQHLALPVGVAWNQETGRKKDGNPRDLREGKSSLRRVVPPMLFYDRDTHHGEDGDT